MARCTGRGSASGSACSRPCWPSSLGCASSEKGILVEDVVKGSPADKAGLKQGDVIVGFAGDKIESIPAFRLKVAASPIGKSFDIDYYRDGRKHTASILPAPAENVVFDLEREQKQEKSESKCGARQDRDRRLRSGSSAAHQRTRQVAWSCQRRQGSAGQQRQGRISRRR